MKPGVRDKPQRRKRLLAWVVANLEVVSPFAMACKLTCENLPDEQIPKSHRQAVTEFRHMTYPTRYKACKRFLQGKLS